QSTLLPYTTLFRSTHVLSMDQTFNDGIMYRAITNETLHHVGYVFIILVEAFIMLSCWIGGIQMLRHTNADARAFHTSKRWGIIGLKAGLMVCFLGFVVIAGELFCMWMSNE